MASLTFLVSAPWAVQKGEAASPTAQRVQPSPAEAAPSPHDAVARARILECGHQWNNMKRAGTASGTWKDFSRDCLAAR